MGIGFVMDDNGCGFADFDTAIALRPDISKLCTMAVRQAGASPRQIWTSSSRR